MNKANVNLSEKEQMLMTNTDWILTKHQVIKKICRLFGNLSEDFTLNIDRYKEVLPAEVIAVTPKIYKGEQYQLLPYVMMDYPRYYKAADAFALRHFFWWGNFFSTTLYIAGVHKKNYEEFIALYYDQFCNGEWFICINQDPWQHDFSPENYSSVASLTKEEWISLIHHHPFIKLAKKIPLYKWDKAYDFFTENFVFLLETIKAKAADN